MTGYKIEHDGPGGDWTTIKSNTGSNARHYLDVDSDGNARTISQVGHNHRYRISAISPAGTSEASEPITVGYTTSDPSYSIDTAAGKTNSVVGVIGAPNDEDHIEMDLVGGATYRIHYTTIPNPGDSNVANNYSSLIPRIDFKRNGPPVTDYHYVDGCCGLSGSFTHDVPADHSGNHQVIVGTSNHDQTGLTGAGYYRITVTGSTGAYTLAEADTPTGSCAPGTARSTTECSIKHGASATGTIREGANNADTWATALDHGQDYTIKVTLGASAPSAATVTTHVRFIDESSVAVDQGRTTTSELTVSKLHAGFHYISITGSNMPTDVPYTIEIAKSPPKGEGDVGECRESHPCHLTAEYPFTATLSGHAQKDWFTVDMDDNSTYHIYARTGGDDGNLNDPTLIVYLNNTPVALNNNYLRGDSGNWISWNSRVIFNTGSENRSSLRIVVGTPTTNFFRTGWYTIVVNKQP